MLSADYLRLLQSYADWATERLLTAADGLSPEELAAAPLPAHGSLLDVLAHTLAAEHIWGERLQGGRPTSMLSAADLPTLEALRTAWAAESARWQELLATLTDERARAPITYVTLNGTPFTQPLWAILSHLANHGTQHRAEAAAMLTIMGRSPGDLDMIKFYRERGI